MKRRQVSRDGKRERERVDCYSHRANLCMLSFTWKQSPVKKTWIFFCKVAAAAAFLVSFCLHAGTLDRITTLSLDRLGILG